MLDPLFALKFVPGQRFLTLSLQLRDVHDSGARNHTETFECVIFLVRRPKLLVDSQKEL